MYTAQCNGNVSRDALIGSIQILVVDNTSEEDGIQNASIYKYFKKKNNSDTYFLAYKIKSIYFMTKQVVWTFRKFLFLQFDTKFASKQQRLVKIDTILWLLLLTQISQIWLATGKIRGRKGQYYKAHIPRSWPLLTTAHFATKGGLIQIQTGMHWWRKWMENHF